MWLAGAGGRLGASWERSGARRGRGWGRSGMSGAAVRDRRGRPTRACLAARGGVGSGCGSHVGMRWIRSREAGAGWRRVGPALSAGPARMPADLMHLVLIRLKDPLDTADLVRDCRRLAEEAPMVRAVFTGLHAETGRSVVVRDYDVCFALWFDDTAAYGEYLHHPAHKAILERWGDRIEWLRIHDTRERRCHQVRREAGEPAEPARTNAGVGVHSGSLGLGPGATSTGRTRDDAIA